LTRCGGSEWLLAVPRQERDALAGDAPTRTGPEGAP
jgi:hypothetical protein